MERNITAKVHEDFHKLRKETCEEFDEIFRRLNIRKKMSMQKADIVISIRQNKLREFEAKRYGVGFRKKRT